MRNQLRAALLRLCLSILLLVPATLTVAQPVAAASVIYVRAGATGANNGKSWADAYKSLTKALTVAKLGQKIWVAKGTYKPGKTRNSLFVVPNGVAVYGGFAGGETSLKQRNPKLNVTILSGDIGVKGDAGDNTYHVVAIQNATLATVLDGFTVTRGNANAGAAPDNAGGGLYLLNDSNLLSLRNLNIKQNSAADRGGGIYLSASGPSIINVTFSGNSATNGGAYAADSSSPSLSKVTFKGNTAGWGAGMYIHFGSPQLSRVSFTGNTGTQAAGIYDDHASPILTDVTISGGTSNYGGGMFNYQSSPSLTRVVFSGNSAVTYGGGLYNYGASTTPSLTDVAFTGNSASDSGGGMMNEAGANPSLLGVTLAGNSASNYGGGIYNLSSYSSLLNVTFSGNSADYGGGMYNDNSSQPSIYHATFAGNTAVGDGGGMYNYQSLPYIYRSIFWGDSTLAPPLLGTEIANASSTPFVNDSVVAGGCPSGSNCNTNIVTTNPMLGPLQNNGGFTQTMSLGPGSSALDAITICASVDQRGVSRPQGLACDMGAYEVRAQPFLSQAASDGQILESAAGSNTGGSKDSFNAVMRVGDDSSGRRYRGILSFSTAILPDTAQMVYARLSVTQAAPATGNPFSTQGQLVADVTKPYFGSAASLELADFQSSSKVLNTGTLLPDGNSYWTALNGPGLAAINKTGTTQLRLRFTLQDSDLQAEYLSLYSGNTMTPNVQPSLLVYYNP